MVPIHEQGGEGLLVQPVQPILIFLASIPQSSKITRYDYIVLSDHLLLLWEVFAPKALEVAVSITRNINCHSIAPRFTGSFAAALAVGS